MKNNSKVKTQLQAHTNQVYTKSSTSTEIETRTKPTQVMLNYLENHLPSLHNKLDGVVPTKLDLPWQTDKNFVYCGVFAMRHMETYKGQPINEWANDCGLKEEAEQS
ncbi:hypothetical protein R6Q57_006328, partial [Mikania cordata]